MITLALSIFIASLLGSMHCVGMCGPMALWASNVGGAAGRGEAYLRLLAYHIGRLATFLIFGLAAGLIGGLLTSGGDWLGWQQSAARIAGSLMIGLGVWKLLNWWHRPNVSVANFQARSIGNRFSAIVSSKLVMTRPWINRLPGVLRATAIGSITTLLPCGWLYLFVLVAAATASPKLATLVMVAFWVGTLPALTALVGGAMVASSRIYPSMPLIVAIVLMVTGTYTASGRAATDLTPLTSSARAYSSVQGNASEWSDPWIVRLLNHLVAEKLPCCEGNGIERQAVALSVEPVGPSSVVEP